MLSRFRAFALSCLFFGGEGCSYGKRAYFGSVVRDEFSGVEMLEMFKSGDKKIPSCAAVSRSIYCRRQAEN